MKSIFRLHEVKVEKRMAKKDMERDIQDLEKKGDELETVVFFQPPTPEEQEDQLEIEKQIPVPQVTKRTKVEIMEEVFSLLS